MGVQNALPIQASLECWLRFAYGDGEVAFAAKGGLRKVSCLADGDHADATEMRVPEAAAWQRGTTG